MTQAFVSNLQSMFPNSFVILTSFGMFAPSVHMSIWKNKTHQKLLMFITPSKMSWGLGSSGNPAGSSGTLLCNFSNDFRTHIMFNLPSRSSWRQSVQRWATRSVGCQLRLFERRSPPCRRQWPSYATSDMGTTKKSHLPVLRSWKGDEAVETGSCLGRIQRVPI